MLDILDIYINKVFCLIIFIIPRQLIFHIVHVVGRYSILTALSTSSVLSLSPLNGGVDGRRIKRAIC